MLSEPNRIDHALALAAQNRLDEADTLLLHLARHGKDPVAAWHLGWLRLRAGNAEDALAILREFAADPICSERAREQLVGERRNAEALALLKHAPRNPDDPRGLVATAVEQHLAGNYPAAVESCRRALVVAPAHAPAHNHLGRALHNLGQTAAARAEFERAVHADPRYPEAWHNLGHSLRACNELERSCEALQRALEISPGYRSARLNLGINLCMLEQPEPALVCFETLLKRNRDDVDAMVNAGLCMQLRGELGKARQRYERALELAPDNPSVHYYLGVLLNELSDPAAAAQSLQRALTMRPDDADAWAELAGVHELSSELDKASSAVQAGLKVAPGHPLLNIEAAKLERRRDDALGAEARLRRLDPGRLSVRVRQQYYYELGNVLDRNTQTEAAFRAFEQANALAAQSVRRRDIDGEAFFRGIDGIGAWFDDGSPGLDAIDDGDQGADLCFLIGFPRSGTTLLDTLLDAHPGMVSIEEKPTLEPLIHTIKGLPGGYPAAIAQLDRSDRLALRRMYRMAIDRHGAVAGKRVLDKLPLRTIHAGLVQTLFPKARLLFALRHPCDVVLSNFMQQYAVNEAFVHFYTMADTVRMYDAVLGLWRKLEPRLTLPQAYVRYEDLVLAPDEQMAATCAFLGLDWDPAMLEARQRNQGRGRIRTNSYHQVAEPIYRRALGRWERYRPQLEPFLATLAPHAGHLGYRLD